ncbi:MULTISPECIES: hypothetical protein [unclassified Inquilinus]|uniref:hypothetical protein n=1 Tax=unclassified Inquilinus TaxID=2645927 RepID=UPI003F93B879
MKRWIVGLALAAALLAPAVASAEDSARTRQLRLLCAQLSGDLTSPGGIAQFRRCLSQDPVSALRQNALGPRAGRAASGPTPSPPAGYGRDSRTVVASVAAKFQIVGGKTAYVLATDHGLWRQTMGAQDARLLDPAVAAFHALDDTVFYALDPDGRLWRETGDVAARQAVDTGVAAFQPLADGTVYVLGRDDRLWRGTGDMTDRVLVDGGVAAFQAIDATVVYVRGKDGMLWRETGTAADRKEVASAVTDFRIAGDTIYAVTGADAALWRRTGEGEPQKVDVAVAAFQPVDATIVYVLDTSGRLWRQGATARSRQLVDTDVLVQAGTTSFQAIDAEHVHVLDSDHTLWAETMPPLP